jgi:hypothetical protein
VETLEAKAMDAMAININNIFILSQSSQTMHIPLLGHYTNVSPNMGAIWTNSDNFFGIHDPDNFNEHSKAG